MVKNTDTPAAPAGISFDDAEPVTVSAGRPAAPNPFAEPLAAFVAAEWDDATGATKRGRRFTVPTADVGKNRRRLSEAAAQLDPPRSVRFSIGDDKNGQTVVTFSLTSKIKRGVNKRDAAAVETSAAE